MMEIYKEAKTIMWVLQLPFSSSEVSTEICSAASGLAAKYGMRLPESAWLRVRNSGFRV